MSRTILWRLCGVLVVAGLPHTAQPAELYDTSNFESLEATQTRLRELEARNAELEAELVQRDAESADCGNCCCCCGPQPANWFDPCCCGPTVSAFVAGDGWADASDFFAEDNFGNRFGIDTTWALGGGGTRAHFGASYGLYDYHGHRESTDSSSEGQVFLTLGAYRRASGCCGDVWTWGVAWDYLNDDAYGLLRESIELHQGRFLVGRVSGCNELGVWGAFGIEEDAFGVDDDEFGLADAEIASQDQVNLYWRRYYEFGGETMLYLGLADPNLTASTLNADRELSEVVVGLRGTAPLTCNMGLFGGFHYVIPSASGDGQGVGFRPGSLEESWNVTFGVMFVRGCSLPVLPLADNGSFGKQLNFGSSD